MPKSDCQRGHSLTSHTSCWIVPTAHCSGPAISTKRNTLVQAAPSAERPSANRSGCQLAPHENSASPRSPRHAARGGAVSGLNVSPPSVERNAPEARVATSTSPLARATTARMAAVVDSTSVYVRPPSAERYTRSPSAPWARAERTNTTSGSVGDTASTCSSGLSPTVLVSVGRAIQVAPPSSLRRRCTGGAGVPASSPTMLT